MSMSMAEFERSQGLHPIHDPDWTPPPPGACWCGRPADPKTLFCDQHPYARTDKETPS